MWNPLRRAFALAAPEASILSSPDHAESDLRPRRSALPQQ